LAFPVAWSHFRFLMNNLESDLGRKMEINGISGGWRIKESSPLKMAAKVKVAKPWFDSHSISIEGRHPSSEDKEERILLYDVASAGVPQPIYCRQPPAETKSFLISGKNREMMMEDFVFPAWQRPPPLKLRSKKMRTKMDHNFIESLKIGLWILDLQIYDFIIVSCGARHKS